MVRGFLLLLAAFFLVHGEFAYAVKPCNEILSFLESGTKHFPRPKLKVDGTDGLVAYLGELLSHQVIGDGELLRLIDGLESGVLINPIHEEQTWVSSAHLIHREEIEEYLRGSELNRAKLLEWAKKSLKEKERVRHRREETRVETEDIHQKQEFHPVPSGRFQMGEGQHKVTVNLTHPFEMMSTQVTQKHWVELMHENPSRFVDGDQTLTATVAGKSVKMQPDNPVEQVTWWSAIVYANRLSEKRGLKPVYDLSGVTWKNGTSAEAGTLDAESGEPKINAPKGDIYQTEGFRLPTEAEQEYMMRDQGKAGGNYHFGDDEALLPDHAWYSANSNNTTHPVAQLKPLTIDGKDFYDLHGNVWEWTHDWYGDSLKGGADPQGPKTGSYRVIRGGGWNSAAPYLRSASRGRYDPGNRCCGLGFRLVRTVK